MFSLLAAPSSAKLLDSHECNAHHSQANNNDLLPLVGGPGILGTVFFWIVAIDWHFSGLHARGGVCPRHGGICERYWNRVTMMLLAVKRVTSSSQADVVMRLAQQRLLWGKRSRMRCHSVAHEAKANREKEVSLAGLLHACLPEYVGRRKPRGKAGRTRRQWWQVIRVHLERLGSCLGFGCTANAIDISPRQRRIIK